MCVRVRQRKRESDSCAKQLAATRSQHAAHAGCRERFAWSACVPGLLSVSTCRGAQQPRHAARPRKTHNATRCSADLLQEHAAGRATKPLHKAAACRRRALRACPCLLASPATAAPGRWLWIDDGAYVKYTRPSSTPATSPQQRWHARPTHPPAHKATACAMAAEGRWLRLGNVHLHEPRPQPPTISTRQSAATHWTAHKATGLSTSPASRQPSAPLATRARHTGQPTCNAAMAAEGRWLRLGKVHVHEPRPQPSTICPRDARANTLDSLQGNSLCDGC